MNLDQLLMTPCMLKVMTKHGMSQRERLLKDALRDRLELLLRVVLPTDELFTAEGR